jgi:amidase
MKRVARECVMASFDRRIPPAIHVQPGEKFAVETEDSRGGLTRTPETSSPGYLRMIRKRGYVGNPVVGPIYIEGAEPGDTLAIHIHEQSCDSQGYMGYWPWLFHLEDFFDEPCTVIRPIRDGKFFFRDDLPIPVRPMIGTIGTTPAVECPLSSATGRHGGNFDTPEICQGSTVYLPVYVPGALLALGDCHAMQGDGEIGSVEIRSTVTMSCDLIRGRSPNMNWPRIETADLIAVVAFASPMEEAVNLAVKDMIDWIVERSGMSRQEAYLLLGIEGHVRPGNAQVRNFSMRCLFPKKYLDC